MHGHHAAALYALTVRHAPRALPQKTYPDAPAGFDGVYVPLLVDDLARFLDAFKDYPDFAGFSVTIPHKVRTCMHTASSAHTPRAREPLR